MSESRDFLVNEQTAFEVQETLKDQAGVVIPAANLTDLTLTLYDAKTGTLINSRNAQSVKNTNGGTVHATSGLFTMTFSALDTALVTATEAEEHHIAEFIATWAGGGKATWEKHLWVRNLALTATVAPDLLDHALLTLTEARDGLGLTKADENARLARLINTVTVDLESRTGRRLKSRTYTAIVQYVQREEVSPDGLAWFGLEWPISTLTSVAIEGTTQTLWIPGDAGDPQDKDVYLLNDHAVHGRDRLYKSAGWTVGARVLVTYTAGYGTASFPIPATLRDLAQALVVERYYAETRQSEGIASRSGGGESISYPAMPTLAPRHFQAIAALKRWAA